jgi:acyl-CoA hydrolase
MREISIDSLAGILAALPGEPRVVASGNLATPASLLRAVDAAVPRYRLYMLNAQPGIPDREGVTYETSFVGPGMRNSPRLRYYPSRLSLVPRLLRQRLQPDLVLLHTSVPEAGSVSLGVEVNVLPAAIEAANAHGGLVIAQASPGMPVTYGDATIPLERVDYLVETDDALGHPTGGHPDDVAADIGIRVAKLIPGDATLQLGIGAIPDATLAALTHHTRLRIWSEMVSDGVLALEQAGCLDPETPISASFLLGSPRLYDWADHNQRVRMLRTETTNDPGIIAGHPNLVSINTAIEVDLFAQANACRVRGQVYSGFGGQTDFIVGALHSQGGQAIIALRSWHPKADTSTIVPLLTGPVTSFQHSFIVTEQGTAAIWGQDQTLQSQHILDHAAHPAARDELRAAGRRMGLRLR